MKRSIQRSLRLAVSTAMVVTLVVMTAGLASAAGPMTKVTYNSVPNNLPGNVVSQAFQAQQTSEFGDSVTLAAGPRGAESATVVMSSWGCQYGTWYGGDCATAIGTTFSHNITLNLYAVDGTTGEPTGAPLVTQTQSFNIPFRPSANLVKCTGDDEGKWYNKADKTCYNGFATKITFQNLGGIALPSNVIWTVAFNTSGYGTDPLGYETACAQSAAGCGYDSLNVGTQSFNGQPSKGTDVDSDQAVRRGFDETQPLLLENGWTGYRPLATIRTK